MILMFQLTKLPSLDIPTNNTKEIGNFLLLNPTVSVRIESLLMSNYILWDSDKKIHLTLKSFTFDIELVISEMKSKST